MILACFTPFVTCYLSTLWCFIAFSITNLLIRCHSVSCLFLLFLVSEKLVRKYYRNCTKQKGNFLFFQKLHGVRRRDEDGDQRGHTTPRRGPPSGRARAWCGPPWPPPMSHLHLFKTTPWKTLSTRSKNPRTVPLPSSSSTLEREGSEAVPSALPERRIIAGGLYIAMPSPGLMSE